MKHKYSKLFITVLSIISVVIFAFIIKNIVIEYKITQKLKDFDTAVKSVDCSGFIETSCVISGSKIANVPLLKSFELNIKKVLFDSPRAVSKIVEEKRVDDGDKFFIKIEGTKFISKESSDSVDMLSYVTIIKSANRLLIKLRKSSIIIKKEPKGYRVVLDINHDEINNLLYNIYKLEFLELKETNNPIIAAGFNISLGVNSPNLIEKEEFLKESLPMFIEFLSSEIVSKDWFINKNYLNLLNKILDDLFKLNGKKEYTI